MQCALQVEIFTCKAHCKVYKVYFVKRIVKCIFTCKVYKSETFVKDSFEQSTSYVEIWAHYR